MNKKWAEYDLQISDSDRGLLITQNGDGYVAKNWNVTQPVINIFEKALKYGLTCLLQNGHPQPSKREPEGDGAEYIAFSRVPNELWVMCIDDNSPSSKKSRNDVLQVLFNKRYRGVLTQAGVPWKTENFRNASNIFVPVENFEDAIKACIPYLDIHAKRGGKRGKAGEYPGFREEADIERWLMENFNDEMLNRKIRVTGRQVRIDAGIIDILLEDKGSGEIIIVEVKQGRAQPVVIEEQLQRYITSDDMISRANGKPILGCVVAEKIEKTVIDSINNSPHKIVGYEINWQNKNLVTFNYIAGKW